MRITNRVRVLIAAAVLSCCLPLSSAPADVISAASSRIENACDIIGTVAETKKVIRTPFKDGAPSTMMIIETHVSVNVENREAHKKTPANAEACGARPKNEITTYKLCSAEKPMTGDKILATEGGATGTSDAARCLFDLQIMPKPSAATAKH